jgi:hypothetical protein
MRAVSPIPYEVNTGSKTTNTPQFNTYRSAFDEEGARDTQSQRPGQTSTLVFVCVHNVGSVASSAASPILPDPWTGAAFYSNSIIHIHSISTLRKDLSVYLSSQRAAEYHLTIARNKDLSKSSTRRARTRKFITGVSHWDTSVPEKILGRPKKFWDVPKTSGTSQDVMGHFLSDCYD